MNEPTIPNYSEQIKDVISLFQQAESDYAYNYEQVNVLDRQTQDLLHSLELDNLSRGERNKLATKLRDVRQERRIHKDVAQATQPIVDFLQSERGKQTYNLLREVQGKTRKIEEYRETRVYHTKVTEPPKDE